MKSKAYNLLTVVFAFSITLISLKETLEKTLNSFDNENDDDSSCSLDLLEDVSLL
ncbi:MAG: hypothetical protein SCH66_14575 [Methanolobus sp.]|nr:hypothetical protein [Methanolobus sp.]